MSIVSLEYCMFCIILVLLYYTVFRNYQWLLLLAGSIIFYYAGCREYFFCILITILSTYIFTNKISGIYKKISDKKLAKKKAKCYLLLSLSINIFLLIIMKYFDFIGANINRMIRLTGSSLEIPAASWILPLGISFYTFSVIGYTLDVYWKRNEAEKNILKLALFVTYFPHILQGPIAKFSKLSPQFFIRKSFDYEGVKNGIILILYGLIKKLILANRLSTVVSPLYDNYQEYTGFVFIPALLLYSFEIYFDFSGCMDIISGVSEIFGIQLERNFRHPNFARTIPEFWQRWHISLGEWFKNYIFFPVSISKAAKKINHFNSSKFGGTWAKTFANILPLFSVWILTGLWHGAGWKFVIWGLFHFTLIAAGTIFGSFIDKAVKKLGIRTQCFSYHVFQVVRTFLLCTLGRVFFRAAGAGDAFAILKRTFTVSLGPMFNGFEIYQTSNLKICFFFMAVVGVVSFLGEKLDVRRKLQEQNLYFRWAVYLFMLFSVILFGIYGPGESSDGFLYQRF